MKDFALAHPYLTTLMFISFMFGVFELINRAIRSRTIAAKGWPPPHLDADGDFEQEYGE